MHTPSSRILEGLEHSVSSNLRLQEEWRVLICHLSQQNNPVDAALLKRYVREGIPDCLRGAVWLLLVQYSQRRSRANNSRPLGQNGTNPVERIGSYNAAGGYMAACKAETRCTFGEASNAGMAIKPESGLPQRYENLQNTRYTADGDPRDYEEYAPLEVPLSAGVIPVAETDIIRDIGRTFPRMDLFREKGEYGQMQLFNVLRRLSHRHADVGYCQGMGFIAGFLLLYVGEMEATNIVSQMLGFYRVEGLFKPGFPELPLRFYQLDELIAAHLPRLSKHFSREHVTSPLFASQWIITLFSCSAPLKILARIWDIFFVDGFKTIFRVSLAILKLAEEELLRLSFEQILLKLKAILSLLSVEDLIGTAVKIKVTRSKLQDIELEYKNTTTQEPLGKKEKKPLASASWLR